MGLLTQEVKIGLKSQTMKYYKEKGYEIPKYYNKNNRRYMIKKGTKIIVKVEDLTDGNTAKVNVQCDNCGKILKNTIWQNYKRQVHEDGTYYCNKCTHNLFASKTIKQTLLQKGESFGYWLIKNLPLRQATEIIARWDEEKNGCDIRYVCSGSEGFDRKGYWLKCLKHPEHGSELHSIANFTYGQESSLDCNKCNSIGQYIVDIYGVDKLNYYWDWYRNVDKKGKPLNPFSINKGSNKKIYIYCQECSYHGSYVITCHSFSCGIRCGYCSGKKIHPFDSLGYYIINKFGQEFLNKIWSKKNKKSPFQYTPHSKQHVYFKCSDDKHEDFFRVIDSSTVKEFRCPECVQEMTNSVLQQKVNNYLNTLNYTILNEYNCTIIPINPKTKRKLPFDNEIKELKLLVEVNGIQHYKISSWHKIQAKKHKTTPEYELHMQQVRDRYKKFIAYKKGYNYLVIPYWDIEHNENYKTIINNKLNASILKEAS